MSQVSPSVSLSGSGDSVREGLGAGKLLVLGAGIATTALALFGVWWLDNNTTDFNVMGWYADYVLPAGALLVGMVAGSGYGVASYLTGLRIRRGLLLAVLALQLSGYAPAQYLEFRSLTREGPLVDADGQALGFARYYQARATSFAWEDHGKRGEPLGNLGYLFVGLGVVGFALGGMLAPALLMKMPYCERCSLYMKTRALALVPASARRRRVSKKDAAGQAAYAEEQKRAAANATALLEQVSGLAARGDALGVKTALAAYPPRGAEARRVGGFPARLSIRLARCRQCSSGHLQPQMITGQGRGIRVKALERLALPPGAPRVIAGD
ncbi:MAG TPA: hypothetical protein VKZ18_16085 [Polyangia bacterium]|nr:hypothetical protein [Polyangia bacterium]